MSWRLGEVIGDHEMYSQNQISLQSATGTKIKTQGAMDVECRIGKVIVTQTFHITSNVDEGIILGRDFLRENQVKLNFQNETLEVRGQVVRLENDDYLASLIRMTQDRLIPPQSGIVCWGKARMQRQRDKKMICQIRGIETGHFAQEPGLMVANVVSRIKRKQAFPFLVTNNTNRHVRLRKGNVIGQLEEVRNPIEPIQSTMRREPTTPSKVRKVNVINTSTGDPIAKDQWHQQLDALIERNADLFATNDLELGETKTTNMRINTGNHPPIRLKPYRTALRQREVVDQAVDDMLAANIIKPSKSPWSFPVVIVEKKDGSKRFCVDFRRLNQISKNYVWPLPHIDDILASFGQAKCFSSLDLKSGYWQVPMEESDKEKTAFTCHKGLFEFNVMPFGLTNAPSVFQELMTHVLEGINGEFAMAYLDDIVIFSNSPAEHLEHLENIFRRLRKHGLKLKRSKCEFLKDQINYLGFIVGEQGVQVDPDKVSVIEQMAPPTDVRGIRSFIGMASYYRRFCPQFSEIAAPMVALTKKKALFHWSPECQIAFDKLKQLLVQAPTLAFPDASQPYTLYTDASDQCVGALLTQGQGEDEHNIHYLSHKLSDTQKRWPVIEKEAYAIVYALQKLDHYLHGAEFVIKTDHKPLKYLFTAEMKNRKIQMWGIAISGYNCTIEYLEGAKNTRADMLSRLPGEVPEPPAQVKRINVINSNRVDPDEERPQEEPGEVQHTEPQVELPDLGLEQRKDPDLKKLIKSLEAKVTSKAVAARYVVLDGILHYVDDHPEDPKLRILVPDKYKSQVLRQFHEDCGHWRKEKMYQMILQRYHWIGMYKDIVEHEQNCVECKTRLMKKGRHPLREMDAVHYPFQKIGIDTCGPYPESINGNKYIVTIVDQYSGWADAYPVPDKTADRIAGILLNEVIPRHQCPQAIVTDNGSEYRNQVMETVCREMHVNHIFTSTYHPQGNGKTERFHRVLNDMLAKKTGTSITHWDDYIPHVLGAYRVGISDTTQHSPFFLLYGRDPVLPLDNLLRPRRKYLGEDYTQVTLERQHETYLRVKRNLRKARQRQKRYHDRKAVEVEYKVGDAVYLFNNQKSSKLEAKWKTHYRILVQHSPVTFTVKHQITNNIRKVHVDQLRQANLEEWPEPPTIQPLRAAQQVVTPNPSDSSDDDSQATEIYTPPQSPLPSEDEGRWASPRARPQTRDSIPAGSERDTPFEPMECDSLEEISDLASRQLEDKPCGKRDHAPDVSESSDEDVVKPKVKRVRAIRRRTKGKTRGNETSDKVKRLLATLSELL